MSPATRDIRTSDSKYAMIVCVPCEHLLNEWKKLCSRNAIILENHRTARLRKHPIETSDKPAPASQVLLACIHSHVAVPIDLVNNPPHAATHLIVSLVSAPRTIKHRQHSGGLDATQRSDDFA
jgi:hypothetical protein